MSLNNLATYESFIKGHNAGGVPVYPGPSYYVYYCASPAVLQALAATNHYDTPHVFLATRKYARRKAITNPSDGWVPSDWDAAVDAAIYQFRDLYALPNNGAVAGYYNFTDGLTEHYFETYDSSSRNTSYLISQNAAYANPFQDTDVLTYEILARETSFAIISFLNAEKLGYPSRPQLTTYVNKSMDHIAQWIGTSPNANSCTLCQSFMMGLACKALLAYYDRYRDTVVTGIPARVKLGMDWIYDHSWDAGVKAFRYANNNGDGSVAIGCPHYDDNGAQISPDLNAQISPIFYWQYFYSGDTAYLDKADIILDNYTGSLGQIPSQKVWNEGVFWQIPLGFDWRERGAAEWTKASAVSLEFSTNGNPNITPVADDDVLEVVLSIPDYKSCGSVPIQVELVSNLNLGSHILRATDTSFSTTGSWLSGNNTDGYSQPWKYAACTGTTANATARWAFSVGVTAGQALRVCMTYPTDPNRGTSLSYRILDSDGTTVLYSSTMNQQALTGNFRFNGFPYVILNESVTPTGSSIIVEINNGGNTGKYVIADTVFIQPHATAIPIGDYYGPIVFPATQIITTQSNKALFLYTPTLAGNHTLTPRVYSSDTSFAQNGLSFTQGDITLYDNNIIIQGLGGQKMILQGFGADASPPVPIGATIINQGLGGTKLITQNYSSASLPPPVPIGGTIINQGMGSLRLVTQGYISATIPIPDPNPDTYPTDTSPFPIIEYDDSVHNIYQERFVEGTTQPILHNGRASIISSPKRLQYKDRQVRDDDLARYDVSKKDRYKNYNYYKTTRN